MQYLNNEMRIIRYDESNKNIEALRGQYAQMGESKYSVTVIKNVLFINLYKGCSIDVKLPNVYDGFLVSSKGRRIEVNDSELKCDMASDETAFGQLVLRKWN